MPWGTWLREVPPVLTATQDHAVNTHGWVKWRDSPPLMSTLSLGIDFGTTNSSIARAGRSGEMELARFPAASGLTDAYRSILYLEQVKERGVSHTKSWSGPAAIEEYLAAETKG